MSHKSVGIGDMALYVPTPKIDLETILARRTKEDEKFGRRLRRAIDATGQIALRYPEPYEDTVTMAAHAARAILPADRAKHVRHFAVGTETSVDMSKPVAAYAAGLLQRGGVTIPREVSTFQVQHACAGGTIAMTSVAAMLTLSGDHHDNGVVVCSDVARYTAPSTAEITQGAGAVAMRIERDPDLLELDLSTVGLASADVDDFFRPLVSITARVKGRYSVDCYNDALDAAVRDHATRRGVTPREILEGTDIFVLHVPFYKMAVTALTKIVERYVAENHEDATTFIAGKDFDAGIKPAREIGNIYSGSAYMSLMYSLQAHYRTYGAAIVGRRVLLGSYGSGNTMVVIGGTIAKRAPEVIEKWNLDGVLAGGEIRPFSEYELFTSAETHSLDYGPVMNGHHVDPGTFYLDSIREDGYRTYAISTP